MTDTGNVAFDMMGQVERRQTSLIHNMPADLDLLV